MAGNIKNAILGESTSSYDALEGYGLMGWSLLLLWIPYLRYVGFLALFFALIRLYNTKELFGEYHTFAVKMAFSLAIVAIILYLILPAVFHDLSFMLLFGGSGTLYKQNSFDALFLSYYLLSTIMPLLFIVSVTLSIWFVATRKLKYVLIVSYGIATTISILELLSLQQVDLGIFNVSIYMGVFSQTVSVAEALTSNFQLYTVISCLMVMFVLLKMWLKGTLQTSVKGEVM